MTERYELKTLDALDGVGGDPIAPHWKEYEWPKAPGLDAKHLEDGSAAYRLAKDKDWWALDDLAKVVCGESKVGVGHDWYVLPPAELMKVLAAMRMIGADRFIEFVMPPRYREIQKKQDSSISNQIREARQLSQQAEN